MKLTFCESVMIKMENKMCTPLVSIIIPVYNGSNYMREAIDSALAQTYPNIEILVINDGSKDDGATEKIALSYGSRIRYFSKSNGGVSTALNTGIRNMQGEYFSWLSHDDVYTPDKIQKSVEALRTVSNERTLVCCGSVHIDKNSELLNNMRLKCVDEVTYETWDRVLMRLQKSGSFNGCALLIPRVAFDECGLFDERLRFNQDGFMWQKIFLKGYSLLSIPGVGVMGRIHDKQVTQTSQWLFHKDCESMSEYLIPELLKVSSREQNYLFEYIKYNAKYHNETVVRDAQRAAGERALLGIKETIAIMVWLAYGTVRPLMRNVYYKCFRKMKTS